jgi:hypothetical protein
VLLLLLLLLLLLMMMMMGRLIVHLSQVKCQFFPMHVLTRRRFPVMPLRLV